MEQLVFSVNFSVVIALTQGESSTLKYSSGDTGFERKGNSSLCTDIDECQSNPCKANQTCTNLFNAYNCSCITGFEMDKGSGNCNEINECSSNPCKVNEDCTDLLASYNCTCKANYVHNATNDRCEGKNQFDLETSKNKIFSLLVYVENRTLCHALLWVQIAFEKN